MNAVRSVVMLLSATVVFAQSVMTVAQLESFIKSSIKLHNPDKDVADSLARVRVTSKLDDQTVEELRAAGAGAKTVLALKKLVAGSASLSDAPPPPPKPVRIEIPPPISIEQKQILDQVSEQALNYTDNLPNFICTQITNRHVDPTGTENYSLADTVQEQLTYFDRHETYKVTMVNNRAVTNVDHEQLGGATSSGEFGTMLRYVFEPSSHTEFAWEKWATLRGRRMYVFNFKVQQGFSKYRITDGEIGRRNHRRIPWPGLCRSRDQIGDACGGGMRFDSRGLSHSAGVCGLELRLRHHRRQKVSAAAHFGA